MIPLVGGLNPLWAGEVDVLINIMVKKGILSPEEARGVLADMQKESARETAAVKEVAKETAKETAARLEADDLLRMGAASIITRKPLNTYREKSLTMSFFHPHPPAMRD